MNGYLPGGNWPFLILALFISLPIFLWSCTASKREIGFLKFIILPIIKFINYLIRFLFKSLKQNSQAKNSSKRSRRIEPTIGNKRNATQ